MESKSFSSQKVKEFVQKAFDHFAKPSLKDFIRIPNQSKAFDPQWDTNGLLEKAANHLNDWVKNFGIKGLTSEVVKDQGLSPIIFTEIKGDLEETFLFYGHFDKQPPLDGWDEGLSATKPVEKDGKLYGRGGADDGYAIYGSMIAIRALQEQGLPIPRCVMITEGDQESGSGHVEQYIEKYIDRIGTPSTIFCLDSGTLDYKRLWLTNSLRGYLRAVLRVDVLTEGVHSGDASGIVPSCFRIIRELLSRIEDPKNGTMVQDFQVQIPPNRYKEMYDLAELKGEGAVKQFPFIEGVSRVHSNVLASLIARGWEAQLAVTGTGGLPNISSAGNVKLPFNEVMLSIRLPPTKNSQDALASFQKLLTENPPYGAKVSIEGATAMDGFNAGQISPLLSESLEEASLAYFGESVLKLSEGGSIPFMNFLKKIWPTAQFLVTGVLGPGSNAHGPNEFLELTYVKKLICCMAHILARTSGSRLIEKVEKKPVKKEVEEHGKKHGHHGHSHGHGHKEKQHHVPHAFVGCHHLKH